MKIDEVDLGEEYALGGYSSTRRVRVIKVTRTGGMGYHGRSYRRLFCHVLDQQTGEPIRDDKDDIVGIQVKASSLNETWESYQQRLDAREDARRDAQEAADSFNKVVDAVRKGFDLPEGCLNDMTVTYSNTAMFNSLDHIQQLKLISSLYRFLDGAERDNDGQRVIYLPAK